MNEILTEEEIQKNRELLKKRFENAKNKKKENSNVKKEDPKLLKLKQNPMFSELEKLMASNPDDIQKMINIMVDKMTNDSKQKKNAKKQIKEMMEKIKPETSNETIKPIE
jgi:hypothetical protein